MKNKKQPARKYGDFGDGQYLIDHPETKFPGNAQPAHTPGPWTVAKWGQNKQGIRIDCPEFSGIAFIPSENPKDTANAALIASCPDLLAALETIAAQDSGIPGSTARADCMAAIAKAAIINAKGDK